MMIRSTVACVCEFNGNFGYRFAIATAKNNDYNIIIDWYCLKYNFYQ